MTAMKQRAVGTLDEFDCEVLRNYFLAVVREMVAVTSRAAYSTVFSEALDFSCALFDEQDRMYAQEGGLAVHVGGLVDVLKAIRSAYPAMSPGDVFVHNDPYNGGSHTADVAVAVPVFAGGDYVGMAINRGHWLDIGSFAAGGWAGAYTHAVQEGLCLPPVRLVASGMLNEEVRAIITANIRVPEESMGDLDAQIASCRAAERRILEAVERYGLDGYLTTLEYIMKYSRRRLQAAIAELPVGVFEGSDVLEDDGQGNGPFNLTARVVIDSGRIIVDLRDASPQGAGPANGSWGVVKAAVYTALKSILDPEMPLDSAIDEFVSIQLTPCTWVSPVYPAPVFASTGEPANRVCEAILNGLADAVPSRAMAYSYAAGINVTGRGVNPRTGEEFVFYCFGPGGNGARAYADGEAAMWHIMGSCRNESIELWEQRFPFRFTRFALLPDSGGAGKFRGGLGYVKEFEVLADVDVNAYQDRHRRGAPGICGGDDGAPNAIMFRIDEVWGTAVDHFATKSSSKFTAVPVKCGSLISMVAGGGGGYGELGERAPEASKRDVEFRYVTGQSDQGGE